ncbi:MAG: hypothetical protein EXR62_17380 [Chloroflexi bacterium]|nr:hypothetical protein [Chloroflexota bacterium]
MKNQLTTVRSWQRKFFIAFPLLAAVIFTLALALPALAATSNTTVPISGIGTNPCTGENFTFSGNFHVVSKTTIDGNGGAHAKIHGNYENLTGVGDQGNTYHVPATTNEEINAQVGAETTFTQNFTFVSTGSAANFQVHIDLHITVNPNGTITASFDNTRINCSGS